MFSTSNRRPPSLHLCRGAREAAVSPTSRTASARQVKRTTGAVGVRGLERGQEQSVRPSPSVIQLARCRWIIGRPKIFQPVPQEMPHPKNGTRTRGQARGCLSLRKHLPEPVYPSMGRARIRTVSSSIETIGRDCSEAFHAAYRVACRTSSSSNSGYASSTSSMIAPPAIILRTTPTVVRIPRMVGCPRHTAGSISIRSRGGRSVGLGELISTTVCAICGTRGQHDGFIALTGHE